MSNFTHLRISNGLFHWIHNNNLNKIQNISTIEYLVIKLKISGSTHDGYCSDDYNYHDYEDFSYVKIPLLSFTDDFINSHFTDNNYNGSINDIIDYLNSERSKFFSTILELENIGKSKQGSPTCGSCYCDATSFTELVSITTKSYAIKKRV